MDEGDKQQAAGNLEQALTAYVKAKRFDAAARVAGTLGRNAEAGNLWLEARHPYEAAICFRKIGAVQDCLSALLLVPQSSPRYRDACVHVVSVATLLGTPTATLMAFLAPFVSSVPGTRTEAAAMNQLADTLASEKKFRLANSVYRSILSAWPNDADATDGLASLVEKEKVATFASRPAAAAPGVVETALPAPRPSAPRPAGERGPRRTTLGDALVARDRLRAADLERLLQGDATLGLSESRLIEALVEGGLVTPLEIIQTFAEQTGLPWISDERLLACATAETAAVLTQEQIEAWKVVPISLVDRHLHVAMKDPRDVALLDRVRFAANVRQATGVFATAPGIQKAIDLVFHGGVAENNPLPTQQRSYEPIALEPEPEKPLARGTPPPPPAPPPPPPPPLTFDHLSLEGLMPNLPPMPQGESPSKRHATLSMMPVMPEVGASFAERYDLLALIGEGGSASVFRAHDRELGEPVALKIFRPTGQVETEDVVARFKLELSLSRLLTHANIIRLFDLGLHSGLRYLTMELLEGSDLFTRITERGGPLPVVEGLGLLEQVCHALRAAHERGVIHRDIKPHNLFVTRDGTVKVMDFGIAKRLHSPGVTVAGMTRGTPEYISPEQINNFSNVTALTDLYALGATSYAVFTGAPPFEHPELTALLMAHAGTPPVPPRQKNPLIPEALEAVILKLLEKDPERRVQSARELEVMLREIRTSLMSATA